MIFDGKLLIHDEIEKPIIAIINMDNNFMKANLKKNENHRDVKNSNFFILKYYYNTIRIFPSKKYTILVGFNHNIEKKKKI